MVVATTPMVIHNGCKIIGTIVHLVVMIVAVIVVIKKKGERRKEI